MKIIITGANGQLAKDLLGTAKSGFSIFSFNRTDLDICNPQQVDKIIKEINPDILINTAAYTKVDLAETDIDAAIAVNSYGPRYLALSLKDINARLVHYSTDYVFNGHNNRPYKIDDTTNPINVYGSSKLEGENAIKHILGSNATVIRTSWLYSCHGKNFVKTILQLLKTKDQIDVVNDQLGTPTWTKSIAKATWDLIEVSELDYMYHFTDFGVATWFEFAQVIQQESLKRNLIKRPCKLNPVSSNQFKTAACRPKHSVLDSTLMWNTIGKAPDHWRESLRKMLDELSASKLDN